jgi:hypothetical protein
MTSTTTMRSTTINALSSTSVPTVTSSLPMAMTPTPTDTCHPCGEALGPALPAPC